VAHSARRPLLSVHRAWLRREDLEDCYSQATLELLAQARRGELRYSSPAHLRSLFELRFVSRVRDRRRALRGRSPAQAMLEGALSHSGADGRAVEVADPRADVERLTLLRHELRTLQLLAHGLSPDQRLVLACQIALQMSAAEFCATFGWSAEKHRKVAQRARARLRRLAGDSVIALSAPHGSAGTQPTGGGVGRGVVQRISEAECPVRGGESEEKTGTLL
jgi:DNA-directed RNA polymerase specialized sigma24 family protein